MAGATPWTLVSKHAGFRPSCRGCVCLIPGHLSRPSYHWTRRPAVPVAGQFMGTSWLTPTSCSSGTGRADHSASLRRPDVCTASRTTASNTASDTVHYCWPVALRPDSPPLWRRRQCCTWSAPHVHRSCRNCIRYTVRTARDRDVDLYRFRRNAVVSNVSAWSGRRRRRLHRRQCPSSLCSSLSGSRSNGN